MSRPRRLLVLIISMLVFNGSRAGGEVTEEALRWCESVGSIAEIAAKEKAKGTSVGNSIRELNEYLDKQKASARTRAIMQRVVLMAQDYGFMPPKKFRSFVEAECLKPFDGQFSSYFSDVLAEHAHP